MESSAPVLHDALLLALGVAAVYLVVALLQLLQLRTAVTKPQHQACEPSLGIVDDAVESDKDRFSVLLEQNRTEVLLKQLQAELERLRADMQSLRGEMRLGNANAAPISSPIKPESTSKYSDARRYAQHGMSAAGIAQKCGISLREAELVAALGRDRSLTLLHDRQRAAA